MAVNTTERPATKYAAVKPETVARLKAWMWQNSVYFDRLSAKIEEQRAAGTNIKERDEAEHGHLTELRRYLATIDPLYDYRARPDIPAVTDKPHLAKLDEILMDPHRAAKVSLVRRLVIMLFWGYRTGVPPMSLEEVAVHLKAAKIIGGGSVTVSAEEIERVRVAYLGAMLTFGYGRYFGVAKDPQNWRASRWDLEGDR